MCFLLIVLKLVHYSAKLFVKTSVLYKLMSADTVVIITELSVSSQIYPLWSLQNRDVKRASINRCLNLKAMIDFASR